MKCVGGGLSLAWRVRQRNGNVASLLWGFRNDGARIWVRRAEGVFRMAGWAALEVLQRFMPSLLVWTRIAPLAAETLADTSF